MSAYARAVLIYLPDAAGAPVEASEDRSPTPSALGYDDSPNSLVVKRPSMSRARGQPGAATTPSLNIREHPVEPRTTHFQTRHHLHHQTPLDRLAAATLDPEWSRRLDAADLQHRISLGLCLAELGYSIGTEICKRQRPPRMIGV